MTRPTAAAAMQASRHVVLEHEGAFYPSAPCSQRNCVATRPYPGGHVGRHAKRTFCARGQAGGVRVSFSHWTTWHVTIYAFACDLYIFIF
ncbi:hypothetical protein H6P81_021019 [Aristolochia fimbriata]|uniref:Uncharacterized protein n=1 Tax=Aristolochia fimbriata TaxID=158543 RepID=A0AAV7DWF2_ARIFI|nr:hypothetical protein H6P81_021019 [Aristolochia fimbriata]